MAGHDTAREDAVASSAPLLHIDGHVATITLNRPAHRNRLEASDLDVLLQHFAAVNDQHGVRVLVLRSNTAGQRRPVFCAGYHIGEFSGEQHDPGQFERMADALAHLRPLTICLLNGSVYGGATDLALSCDLRLGLAGSELRMPAAALGLHYYPSGLQRYVQRLGLNGASRAFLTARPFSAERLLAMGVLEELAHTAEEQAEQLRQLLDEVVALAPLAVQATKRSLLEIGAGQPDLAAMRQREVQLAESHDFKEGRLAFEHKRKPRFEGR